MNEKNKQLQRYVILITENELFEKWLSQKLVSLISPDMFQWFILTTNEHKNHFPKTNILNANTLSFNSYSFNDILKYFYQKGFRELLRSGWHYLYQSFQQKRIKKFWHLQMSQPMKLFQHPVVNLNKNLLPSHIEIPVLNNYEILRKKISGRSVLLVTTVKKIWEDFACQQSDLEIFYLYLGKSTLYTDKNGAAWAIYHRNLMDLCGTILYQSTEGKQMILPLVYPAFVNLESPFFAIVRLQIATIQAFLHWFSESREVLMEEGIPFSGILFQGEPIPFGAKQMASIQCDLKNKWFSIALNELYDF